MKPLPALALLALLAPPARALQIDHARPRLPVLLVSGANNHDWEWTHASLAAMLEESGLFAVTITLDPATDLADRELLARQRAVVLDWNGPRWGDAADAAFLAAVRSGLGVCVIHAADNAFPGWTEYEELVAHLWREGTGHGRFHPFDVTLFDRAHPVTSQLPDLRAHPDELYHRLVNTQNVQRRVLADAFSDPETGGTGEREPMVTVGRFGAGRVFHTPLGHVWRGDEAARASHLDPQFRALVVRGTEWAATGHVSDVDPDAGRVPDELALLGWKSLFDGESTAGWVARGGDAFPAQGWSVLDRCLVHAKAGGGGNLVTRETFGEFELAFDFLVTPGANSGVKILIPTDGGAIGPEFQVLDNERHPDGKSAEHRTGSLYDVFAPEVLGGEPVLQHPPGRWNHARIVRRAGVIEHWLNGRLLVRADTASSEWKAAVADSKFKNAADFGTRERGHILLQDHGDEVWYRNLFVRSFDAPVGEQAVLFDGESLAGWTALGDARYTADAGAILGQTGGGGQSFLASDGSYSDFVLELELVNEDAGNSGLQFRSHKNDAGRLFGYQMEIDPSPRAWSGGLYDEARRGWLQDLKQNPAGRAAFRSGETNTYRLECIGPWLRGWVNGVPTIDTLDPADGAGLFGLQVHSGNNTHMRWSGFRLREIEGRVQERRQLDWTPAPESDPCPLGRAGDHRHIAAETSLRANGSVQLHTRPGAQRLLVVRHLHADEEGVSDATVQRLLPLLREGQVLLDGAFAAAVMEFPGEGRSVTLSFLDARIAVHRSGTRLAETRIPPSRWAAPIRFVQCVDASDVGEAKTLALDVVLLQR